MSLLAMGTRSPLSKEYTYREILIPVMRAKDGPLNI